MKVILLENIDKLGKKNEIVDVSSGYGKNYLIKNKKAQLATDSTLKQLESKKERERKRVSETEKEIKDLIADLNGKEFIIKMKVGDKKQLFEAVTAQKISKRLLEDGYNVKENQILIEEPIKDLSEKDVELKFDFGLSTTIKIKIEEE